MGSDHLAPGPDAAHNCEQWRSDLEAISTVFGRLVYLSSLRDRVSGSYAHYDLERLCGQRLARLTIHESHLKTFREWLSLSLRDQKDDLDSYVSGLDSWTRLILSTWAHQKPFRHLIPPGAEDAERELFLVDIDAVTALLRNDFGVDSESLDDFIPLSGVYAGSEAA